MPNYRQIEQKRGELILANPADSSDTLRFTTKESSVQIGSGARKVQANMIENWKAPIKGCGPTESCTAGYLPQSIRVYLSLDLDDQVNSGKRVDHAIACLTAAKADLLNGFVPAGVDISTTA